MGFGNAGVGVVRYLYVWSVVYVIVIIQLEIWVLDFSLFLYDVRLNPFLAMSL